MSIYRKLRFKLTSDKIETIVKIFSSIFPFIYNGKKSKNTSKIVIEHQKTSQALVNVITDASSQLSSLKT